MKSKKFIIIIVVILALIGLFVVKTLRDAGEFKRIEPHSSYTCSPVEGTPGAEDIAIDYDSGVAYISSFDRRAYFQGEFKQGAIFLYSPHSGMLKNLTADLKFKFSPHGISLYKGNGGRKFLFVINHTPRGHRVEIFDIVGGLLKHRDTIEGDLLISPNDIAGVGPRQFYATNDHGSRSAIGKTIEEYLQLSKSNIVYYDGSQFSVVAKKLSHANGIALSRSGMFLYATSTVGQYFHVYKRNVKDGTLSEVSKLDLNTGPDNIDIGADGTIRVACHPKLLTFVKHSKDSAKKSPSQILEIAGNPDAGFSYTEVYLNDGTELSGSSVAAVYKDRMLMGSVFEGFFLDCRKGN